MAKQDGLNEQGQQTGLYRWVMERPQNRKTHISLSYTQNVLTFLVTTVQSHLPTNTTITTTASSAAVSLKGALDSEGSVTATYRTHTLVLPSTYPLSVTCSGLRRCCWSLDRSPAPRPGPGIEPSTLLLWGNNALDPGARLTALYRTHVTDTVTLQMPSWLLFLETYYI